ncbi:MAG: hypothetical protein ACJA08_003275 [Cyclobacteriaceae bacterium]|jgi:hypothetical protein
MNKSLVVILILGIIIAGCGKRFSKLFYREPTTIRVNEIDFDYFSGKLKIDYDGDKNLSGIANLRMRKDSVIWISLSPGFGVEVARILITKDSISVIDKFNKKYVVTDFAKLSKKFDFNIEYSLVESLLLGNLTTPYSNEKLKKTEEFYNYGQQFGNYNFSNSIGLKSMKLEMLHVVDTVSKSAIYVNYSDFQMVEDQILPFNIKAKHLKGKTGVTSTKVDIEYNKADIEKKPLKFPFNVPQKYERNEAD